MKFSDFINGRDGKKTSKDKELAKALLDNSLKDLKFLGPLEINPHSSRKIMSNYYDVLRSILEAITALDGYKIYSHEAFAYFLREKGEEVMSSKFDRFRKIRNKINYYGEDISVEETKENIDEIKKMIKTLTVSYLKDIL
ncbi:MAG: hypothetical protein PHW96_03835 [Candidatus Nanoarchaeia archaeon]|nr:hypothetical protein [Candidatus Nanoarchaeia archaeon]